MPGHQHEIMMWSFYLKMFQKVLKPYAPFVFLSQIKKCHSFLYSLQYLLVSLAFREVLFHGNIIRK